MLGICLHVTFAVDQKNSVSSFWFSRHWNKGMQVELEGRPWPCNGIRSLLSRHHCHAQHMLLSCCFYCYHQSYRDQHRNDHKSNHYNCRHNSVSVFLEMLSWNWCQISPQPSSPVSSTWEGFSYSSFSMTDHYPPESFWRLLSNGINQSPKVRCLVTSLLSTRRKIPLYFDICSAGVFLSRLNSMPLDIKIYLVRFSNALAKKDLFSSRSYESFEFEFACSRISPL